MEYGWSFVLISPLGLCGAIDVVSGFLDYHHGRRVLVSPFRLMTGRLL